MNAHLLIQPFIERLGWTLVHSLWQGAAIALLLAFALRYVSDAAHRHGLCLAALLLMAASSLATFRAVQTEPVHYAQSSTPAAVLSPMTVASASSSHVVQPPIHERNWEETLRPFLPWLCGLWMLGVALLSLKQGIAWTSLRRWRRRHCEPAEPELQRLAARLCERFRIRRVVRVLKCAGASTPMLLGWLRPAIVLPAQVITGLSREQLEAILAHELAHLRRGDVWVLWLQRLMETLYFFHPGVRWVTRQLQIEREHGCDDLAVAQGAARETLAAALGRLALWDESSVSTSALAATGHMSVLERMRRLLQPAPRNHAGILAPLVALGTLAGITAFALLVIVGHQPLTAESVPLKTESPAGYAATAKLEIQWPASEPNDPDARANFRKAQIEILQGGEVKRLALGRIRALHPEFPEVPVEIHAVVKDSAIIEVTCTALEPRYVKSFTDAVVDEYMHFRMEMVEKSWDATHRAAINKAIEEVLARERDVKDKTTQMHELLREALDRKDDTELQMKLKKAQEDWKSAEDGYKTWKKTLEDINTTLKTTTATVSIIERPDKARKVEGAASGSGSH